MRAFKMRFKTAVGISLLATAATLYLWYRFSQPSDDLVPTTDEPQPLAAKQEQIVDFDFNSEGVNSAGKKKSLEQIDPGTFYEETKKEDGGEDKEGGEVEENGDEVDEEEKKDEEDDADQVEDKKDDSGNAVEGKENVEKDENSQQEEEENNQPQEKTTKQQEINLKNDGKIDQKQESEKAEQKVEETKNYTENVDKNQNATHLDLVANQKIENNDEEQVEYHDQTLNNIKNAEDHVEIDKQKAEHSVSSKQIFGKMKRKENEHQTKIKKIEETVTDPQQVSDDEKNVPESAEKAQVPTTKGKIVEEDVQKSVDANPSVGETKNEQSESNFVDYKDMDSLGHSFKKLEAAGKEENQPADKKPENDLEEKTQELKQKFKILRRKLDSS